MVLPEGVGALVLILILALMFVFDRSRWMRSDREECIVSVNMKISKICRARTDDSTVLTSLFQALALFTHGWLSLYSVSGIDMS